MRRVALAIIGTIAGLVGLLSFKTHTTPVATQVVATSTVTPGPTASAGGSATTPTTTPAAPSASRSSSSASTSSASKASTTKTVTGAAVNTRYGPVQVQITLVNSKITAASAVAYPNNNPRDQQINADAIPALNKEAVGTSTAKIDMISGATYTSNGYIESLQSALTKAGL